jgi:hypothetical protein
MTIRLIIDAGSIESSPIQGQDLSEQIPTPDEQKKTDCKPNDGLFPFMNSKDIPYQEETANAPQENMQQQEN